MGVATVWADRVAGETLTAAGAVSVVTPVTKVALVGAGAITLAAPFSGMIGKVKTIQMTTDNGDVTLALTNVVGGSAATTCTFQRCWRHAGPAWTC